MNAQPTIPLTQDQRDAYEALYQQYETTIESTNDPGVVGSLSSSQDNVDDLLTKDNMYRLHATTALYAALASQLKDTNDEIKKLQAQIDAIAGGASKFADVLAAITKVLSIL